MEMMNKLLFTKGATTIIEFDFSAFNFENNSICQFTLKKDFGDMPICQIDFKERKKYYVTFKDEFTASLNSNHYIYDIMYIKNNERYPQIAPSDIEVDNVVNEYNGKSDINAIIVSEEIADNVALTQTIKIKNVYSFSGGMLLQEKSVNPSLNEQVVIPDKDYNALSKVIVKPVSLMGNINVIPTKEQQIIKSDDKHLGLSQVIIEAIPSEYIIPSGNQDISENGEYNISDKETINVNVQPLLQEKTIEINPLESKEVVADNEYDGLSKVNVIGTIDTETKEVTPTKETQTITRSDDKYIESVTVNAIPDNYIEPSGEMEITENGSYDVKDKASVKVETSGVDINDYIQQPTAFYGNISEIGQWTTMIKKLQPINIENATSISYLFSQFKGNEIDVSDWNTSNVTDMKYLFNRCSNLTEINVSNFDTSKVTDMSYMFAYCTKLKNLDVKNFNTSNVKDMGYMFAAYGGESLDLTNFDTTNTTNMRYMFSGASKLTSIDLSSFNVEKVTSFEIMFMSCRGLTSLDLSNFVTTSLTNTYQMFVNCLNLTYIDMRNFDFTKVTYSQNMFGGNKSNGVPDACEIIVKDDTAKEWITSRFSRLTNVKTVAELGE